MMAKQLKNSKKLLTHTAYWVTPTKNEIMILKGNMEILGRNNHIKGKIRSRARIQNVEIANFMEVSIGSKVSKIDKAVSNITIINDMILMQEMPARRKDKRGNSFGSLNSNKGSTMSKWWEKKDGGEDMPIRILMAIQETRGNITNLRQLETFLRDSSAFSSYHTCLCWWCVPLPEEIEEKTAKWKKWYGSNAKWSFMLGQLHSQRCMWLWIERWAICLERQYLAIKEQCQGSLT